MTDDYRPDVHAWFGLTYSNYLVLNRTLLEAMPEEWQLDFVQKLEELQEAWRHEEQAEAFKVEPGEWVPVDELTAQQHRMLGITSSFEQWKKENPLSDEVDDDEFNAHEAEYDKQAENEVFYLDGNELSDGERVFVPKSDPIDHYRRPREYIPGTFGACR